MNPTREKTLKILIIVLSAIVLICAVVVVAKIVGDKKEKPSEAKTDKTQKSGDFRSDSYIRTDYKYEGEDRVLYKTREVHKDSEGRIVYTCETPADGTTQIWRYEFDDAGRKIVEENVELSGEEEVLKFRETFSYSEGGHSIRSERYKDGVTTIVEKEYNSQVNLIFHKETRGVESVVFVSMEGSVVTEWDYPKWRGTYDLEKILLSEAILDEKGRYTKVVHYTDAQPFETDYTSNDSPWTETYVYEEDGSSTRHTTGPDGEITQVMEYDSDGLLTAQKSYYKGRLQMETTKEKSADARFTGEDVYWEHYLIYGSNEEVLSEYDLYVKMLTINEDEKDYIIYQTYKRNGETKTIAEIDFDEFGRPVRYRRYASNGTDNVPVEEQEFDDHGNTLHCFYYNGDAVEEHWEYEYKYFRADD